MAKYIVIGPGFQCEIERNSLTHENPDMALNELVQDYLLKIEKGETIIFNSSDDCGIVVWTPVKGQHVAFLTLKQFESIRREQMFAAQQMQRGRRQ
jgi:hypothetical protein